MSHLFVFLGFGAGFPVLKKTRKVVREENSPDALSQVLLILFEYHFSLMLRCIYIIKMSQYQQETKPEEKSDTPKQDEAPHRPKWMPPKHPG